MKIRNRSGLTIVELMVGLVIGLILALTLGTMLVYIFMAWRNNSDQVELQRDATFAMDILSRAIRPAAFSQIQTPTAGTSSSTLTINAPAGSVSYDLGGTSGRDLILASATGNQVLIRDRVASLTFTHNSPGGSISIQMNLAEGRETLTVNNVAIGYRN